MKGYPNGKPGTIPDHPRLDIAILTDRFFEKPIQNYIVVNTKCIQTPHQTIHKILTSLFYYLLKCLKSTDRLAKSAYPQQTLRKKKLLDFIQ